MRGGQLFTRDPKQGAVRLKQGRFDLVTALAVVHHMPFEDALDRMRRLLAPRGRLLVLGIWPPTVRVIGLRSGTRISVPA